MINDGQRDLSILRKIYLETDETIYFAFDDNFQRRFMTAGLQGIIGFDRIFEHDYRCEKTDRNLSF